MGTAKGDEPEFFCVDPLDGTNNFVHGVPVVCVSVGFVRGGRPAAGAVYDPVHDELFSAAEGAGARCNGAPLRTSGKASAAGAFVATGFPFKEIGRLDYYLDGFRRILKVTGGVRRCGSAALDMCWTAKGRFDGFWELGLKPWDMAAGTVILREAKGAVTDLDGGEGFLMGGDVVAGATPTLQRELRRLVTGD
jgi:myo-inositol-1(or 4)-monophosphatase